MIVDVVFDIPLSRAFTYLVPAGLTVAVGQRVRAPLHGKPRVGLVVGCREDAGGGLKVLAGAVDPGPLLGPVHLDLTRWISAESYSSWGSTCAALLPPVPPRTESVRFPGPPSPLARVTRRAPQEPPSSGARLPALFLSGGDRGAHLLDLLAGEAEDRGLLLLVPEIEAARAWADRLESRLRQPVVRLDSGRPERERWGAWMALLRGAVRVAVGTRSALLAPVPSPAALVLIDEHDPAHKPPGHPRIHSREVVLKRASLEGHPVILTSATPSVESWWQADSGRLVRTDGSPGPWPEVTVVDARGELRSSPLSPTLRRGIEHALAGGGQVCLLVTRTSSALACGECGFLLRCPDCGIPLAYSRVRLECACRLCGLRKRAPDTCVNCRGRKLAPLGWGAERVEQAVRQAFPRTAVARYDQAALTPAAARQLAARWQSGALSLLIGTRQVLKAFPPARVGLVGVITPDHVLRLPDFRAGERAFAFLWAAAEWLNDRGRLIVQTQHPEHYVIRAVAGQELAGFYKLELRFRAELGYPPFRRLCMLTIRGQQAGPAQALAHECWRELGRLDGLTIFPPASPGRSALGLRWRIVVKGGSDLPEQLRPVLAAILDRRRAGRGVVEIEMDPVELI